MLTAFYAYDFALRMHFVTRAKLPRPACADVCRRGSTSNVVEQAQAHGQAGAGVRGMQARGPESYRRRGARTEWLVRSDGCEDARRRRVKKAIGRAVSRAHDRDADDCRCECGYDARRMICVVRIVVRRIGERISECSRMEGSCDWRVSVRVCELCLSSCCQIGWIRSSGPWITSVCAAAWPKQEAGTLHHSCEARKINGGCVVLSGRVLRRSSDVRCQSGPIDLRADSS